jgi:hypothetical protein
MPAKEYLDAARIVLWAAQTMIDRHDGCRPKALAEDYERRAETAPRADTTEALASFLRRPAVPISTENEVEQNQVRPQQPEPHTAATLSNRNVR